MTKNSIQHVIMYSDQDPPEYGESHHKTIWVNKKRDEAYVSVIGWRRISKQQLEEIEKEHAKQQG